MYIIDNHKNSYSPNGISHTLKQISVSGTVRVIAQHFTPQF